MPTKRMVLFNFFVCVSLTTTQLIGPISMYLSLQSLNAVDLLVSLTALVASLFKLQKRHFLVQNFFGGKTDLNNHHFYYRLHSSSALIYKCCSLIWKHQSHRIFFCFCPIFNRDLAVNDYNTTQKLKRNGTDLSVRYPLL